MKFNAWGLPGPGISSPYNTPMDKQIADSFDIFPSNVFLIKLSYTFLR